MPFDAPIRLGPFTMDEQGGLTPSDAEAFPSFHAHWRGRTLHARLAPSPSPAEGSGVLDLETLLGRVPSTATDAPERSFARREQAFAALRALPDALPPGFVLQLRPDHAVAVRSRCPLALPTTAVILLSEVALHLLTLAPYVGLLEEAGIGGIAGENAA